MEEEIVWEINKIYYEADRRLETEKSKEFNRLSIKKNSSTVPLLLKIDEFFY